MKPGCGHGRSMIGTINRPRFVDGECQLLRPTFRHPANKPNDSSNSVCSNRWPARRPVAKDDDCLRLRGSAGGRAPRPGACFSTHPAAARERQTGLCRGGYVRCGCVRADFGCHAAGHAGVSGARHRPGRHDGELESGRGAARDRRCGPHPADAQRGTALAASATRDVATRPLLHDDRVAAPQAGGTLDARTPALWISNGTGRDGAANRNAPKVGWCWAGNRHTWLGFASAAHRSPLRG